MNPLALPTAHLVRDLFEAEQPLHPGWDHRLGGACAAASWNLRRAFAVLGISSVFVVGLYVNGGRFSAEHEHCWLTIDGTIIDITATQFGIKERVHLPTSKSRYRVERAGIAAVRLVNAEWGRDNAMSEAWFRSRVRPILMKNANAGPL